MDCNLNVSVNTGNDRYTWTSRCCNTDMCNTETVSVSSDTNGLKCCGGSNRTCETIVDCLADEDHCFISVTGSSMYMGCSSASVCQNPASAFTNLGLPVSSQISCCQGGLCNNPNTSLTCYNCLSGQSCMETLCLGANEVCATGISRFTTGLNSTTMVNRYCATPDMCNVNVSATFANLGNANSVQCCNSDLCNTGDAIPIYPNGLVCCLDLTCQNTVTCMGSEDHCVLSDQGLYVLLGCASANYCSSMLCCQRSLCNHPASSLTCNSCYSSDSWDLCSSSSANMTCQSPSMECSSSLQLSTFGESSVTTNMNIPPQRLRYYVCLAS
ncbi:urokinase plasminogen activator surface receptor-like [Erpetoichthys calabaricus]|uniref:urokinase plasminogen activator surface receptor-like n=1 Tax=Erpetoichthys calabaricus TaxID=27687 RepID=UPI0022349B3E|nr:urokinase plasminogen activator surface receptor-like [Erpetoichthys calabaricus]